MKLDTLQIALFFKSIINRPDLEFDKLKKDLVDVFDKMPTTIPVPPGVPEDIPLMILQSSSNKYTCNIAKGRIDLIITGIDNINSELELINKYIKIVFESTQMIQFGVVGNYFHKTDDSTPILKKFLDTSIQNVKDINIKFNDPINFQGKEYNRHISYASIIQEDRVTQQFRKGIQIVKDINNIRFRTSINVPYEELNSIMPEIIEELKPENIVGITDA